MIHAAPSRRPGSSLWESTASVQDGPSRRQRPAKNDTLLTVVGRTWAGFDETVAFERSE